MSTKRGRKGKGREETIAREGERLKGDDINYIETKSVREVQLTLSFQSIALCHVNLSQYKYTSMTYGERGRGEKEE